MNFIVFSQNQCYADEIPTLWVPRVDPGIYRGICDHSAVVSEDSASSLEGLRALQVAKFLQNGGGCQKLGGKNILLLEKKWPKEVLDFEHKKTRSLVWKKVCGYVMNTIRTGIRQNAASSMGRISGLIHFIQNPISYCSDWKIYTHYIFTYGVQFAACRIERHNMFK